MAAAPRPKIRDALEPSITFIDDVDGSEVRRLPKGAEVPVKQAVADFVRRDMAKPGPTTFYYAPPSFGRASTKPPPRSVEELVASAPAPKSPNAGDLWSRASCSEP